jgi:hypothetical protein
MDRDGSVHSTIEYLVNLPRPSDLADATVDPPAYQNRRAAPVEFILWTVEGVLTNLKHEADGDYHMVIQGAGGETMVAEIPNPVAPFIVIDPNSRWAQQIAAARSSVDKKLPPQLGITRMSMRVRITGIGFFDRAHGNLGASPNAIELHPVTHIEFLQ